MKNYTHYYVTELATVLIVIIFGFFLIRKAEAKDKVYLYAMGVAGALALVSWILQIGKSATVINNSCETIKAKPEDCSCEPIDVKPGEKICGIDGVKVNGKVYKASDSTTIVVNSDGTVSPLSFVDKIINSGKKRGYITQCPDDCWKPLFNS